MPYPNEHSARIRNPGDFQKDSFRRKNITTGIDIIVGRLKGKTSTTTQAYRFKSNKYTVSQAKKWLKDNKVKYILFEPATGEKKSLKGENMITRALFQIEDVEIRETDGKNTITGYAAVFEKLSVPIHDWFREKIRKGAFKDSLQNNNVRALWNHNPDFVLGSSKTNTLRLKETDKGLRFELDAPDTQAGRDAIVVIKRGDVDGMSFGFRVRKQEWDEKDPKNIIRTLIDVDLREISPTAFPAYLDTKVKVRTVKEDFEEHQAENQAIDTERNNSELQLMNNRIREHELID